MGTHYNVFGRKGGGADPLLGGLGRYAGLSGILNTIVPHFAPDIRITLRGAQNFDFWVPFFIIFENVPLRGPPLAIMRVVVAYSLCR